MAWNRKTICRGYLRIALLLLLSPASGWSAEPVFSASLLQKMASALHLEVPDSLSAGSTMQAEWNGYPLTICKNRYGEIDHIGLELFPHAEAMPEETAVFRFLERYLLELLLPGEISMQRKLQSDAVEIAKTSACFPKNLSIPYKRLQQAASFSMAREENTCRARWEDEAGQILLEMRFPARYDLIWGCRKDEAEQLLYRHLTSPLPIPAAPREEVDPETLRRGEGYPWIRGGATYLNDGISSDTYYEKQPDGQFSLLCDSAYAACSFANLMLVPDSSGRYDLDLRLVCADEDEVCFSIPLERWKNYARAEGCRAYFGLEQDADGQLVATVLLANEALGYNHLLHVSIGKETIARRKGILRATLHAYVPVHNVSRIPGLMFNR